MASKKCSICGKPGKLTDGVCMACRSVKAYAEKQAEMDKEGSLEFNNEDERAFKGFVGFMAKDIDGAKADEEDYQKYLQMSPEDKRKWEFKKICELNFIDSSMQLKYKPQLLQIMKKYRGLLLDEDVYLCTKEEYARTGAGEVCDIIGNFVIRRFVAKREPGVEIRTSVLLDADELVHVLDTELDEEETEE